jgi:hypothetical protein
MGRREPGTGNREPETGKEARPGNRLRNTIFVNFELGT